MRISVWGIGLGWLVVSACGANSGDSSEQADRLGMEGEDDDVVAPADDDAVAPADDDAVAPADDDAVEPADDDAAPPVTMRPPPKNHRATAETCDRERPPGGISGASSESSCSVDEDCTEGINGRCLDLRGPACTYDECFEDSECSKGGPCGCEQGFWTEANACLGGNCQLDADCGEGGYCSPSMGSCGNYAGIVAYWCRTPEDTCVEDEECVDPAMGAGYCAFYPEVGYWACQYGQCVG